jgi:hypothetical protein
MSQRQRWGPIAPAQFLRSFSSKTQLRRGSAHAWREIGAARVARRMRADPARRLAMKLTTTLAVGIVSSVMATAAVAQTETNATPTVSTVPAKKGVHLHDGFYLRLAMGFGGYNEMVRQAGQDQMTHVTGIANAHEWLIGGAVRPGLIFGGGVFASNLLASDRSVSGATPPAGVADGQVTFSLVGPFFDYYFDPAKGLHVEAAVGIANLRGLNVVTNTFDRDAITVGGGAVIGLGYEWWVSDQWSMGVLGRMAMAWTTGKDNNGVRWYHTVGASPSVLFTATFN